MTQIDHLVMVASTLADGLQWCERTLGVTPGPGGEHPLMGTHNRLIRIATPDHPRAYLEIIAINPEAAAPGRARWFDMDDPALQARVKRDGPQLVHFVASVPQLDAALKALSARGIDRGRAIAASRMTPAGLLDWQIAVRDDGQRLYDGALPTLIQWGATHPARSMPDSGVTLVSLGVTHPRATELRGAFQAIGLEDVAAAQGKAGIAAMLRTPRGALILSFKEPE